MPLNFDFYRMLWAFDWCDPRYKGWGSPSCPEEEHSHRVSTTGARVEKHFVDYKKRVETECFDGFTIRKRI